MYTQTDFWPGHRSGEPGQERRRSSHRSPEKNRKHDDIGSTSERDQKYRIPSRSNKESYKSSSTEREPKHRGSQRDERSRNLSSDKGRGNDRTNDSRGNVKRSRSKSPRQTDEKRRKLDDQQSKHKEPRQEVDLRQKLLKKQANRSSPRKAKTETTSKAELKPKVASPRKRKLVQSQDEAPTKALSIKSSDSEVEIVSVVNPKVPQKIDAHYRIPLKKTAKEKIPEERVPEKKAETAKVAIDKDDRKLEKEKVIKIEKSSSFHSTDEGSKSPRLNELEREILAAEKFSIEQEAGYVVVDRDLDKVPDVQNCGDKIVRAPEVKGVDVAESETAVIIPAAAVEESTPAAVEETPAAVKETQESSLLKQVTLQPEPEAIAVSPVSVVLQKSSPVKPSSSPVKPMPSPAKVKASSLAVLEIADLETPTTDLAPPADQSRLEPQPLLNGTLDSSGASKENSLNKSKKRKKSSKTYEKEVQEDGTVVFTITTKKNKKKDKSKA